MRSLTALTLVATALAAAPLEVFVSPSGSDSAPGTRSEPFKSLEKARDVVRSSLEACRADSSCWGAEGDGEAFATVVLLQGTWTRSSWQPFELEAQDSGPEGRPVVWKADVTGTATVSGGLYLPLSDFKPNTAGKGLVAALPPGTPSPGTIITGTLKDCQRNISGVFLDDGTPLLLARWPNAWPNGTWSFDHALAGGTNQLTVANGSKAEQWAKEGGAIHGYWTFDWSDSYGNIASATPSGADGAANVSLVGIGEIKKNARFIGVNVLSELDDDENGEYYLTPDASAVHVVLPRSFAGKGLYVSYASAVWTLSDVSNINITGITVAHSKLTGMVVQGGASVFLNDVTSHGHGANCTDFLGVQNGGIYGGSIHDCGCMGLSVVAGDFLTLAPGDNEVRGVEIRRMSNWKRTYQAGLFWGGVGNRFEDVFVSDGPHNGVLGGGNEAGGVNVTFVNLTITHVAQEVDDSGAFYTCGQAAGEGGPIAGGNAWVNPGIKIIDSTFMHVRNVVPCSLGYPSVQAIYLDDLMSFHTIINSTFIDCQKGVFIGGGRNTTVTGNDFRDVDVAVHVDNRGLNWQNDRCNATKMSGDCWQGLKDVHYTQPPWSTEFPWLHQLLDGRACVPEHNYVVSNRWCGGNFTDVTPADAEAWLDTFEGNTGTDGPCSS